MNKRQQHQLAQANNKLEQYNKTLFELYSQKSNLEAKQDNTSKEETDNETDNHNNKNYEDARIQQINYIDTYAKEITTLRNAHITATDKLKYLPRTFETNLAMEHSIYNEECLHLQLKQQDAQELHTQQMEQQTRDKLKLKKEINNIQELITTATNNITEIQADAHGFRKNTIAELQANKQQKKSLANQIATLQADELRIKEIESNLASEIKLLLEYKTQIIENHYINANQKPILELLSNKFNIQLKTIDTTIDTAIDTTIDTTIDTAIDTSFDDYQLNTIINQIDEQIANTTIQLEQVQRQVNKATTRNQLTIQSILSKDISNNTLLTRTPKVISYKDRFKLAKLEKTKLEEQLAQMVNEFNNWETRVIKTINENYKMAIEQIENDRMRAKERLDIMSARFNIDYENNKSQLENEISILATKLLTANTNLTNAKKELQLINISIESDTNNKKELEKITARIQQTQIAIQSIENDIASIMQT